MTYNFRVTLGFFLKTLMGALEKQHFPVQQAEERTQGSHAMAAPSQSMQGWQINTTRTDGPTHS